MNLRHTVTSLLQQRLLRSHLSVHLHLNKRGNVEEQSVSPLLSLTGKEPQLHQKQDSRERPLKNNLLILNDITWLFSARASHHVIPVHLYKPPPPHPQKKLIEENKNLLGERRDQMRNVGFGKQYTLWQDCSNPPFFRQTGCIPQLWIQKAPHHRVSMEDL